MESQWKVPRSFAERQNAESMNLKQLASHTVDLDLLPVAANVLDVGCRDWDFADAVLAERPLAQILGLDPSPTVTAPARVNYALERRALVGQKRDTARLFTGSTGHGDFLSEDAVYYDMVPIEVRCVTMAELCRTIPFWDCVKLDCEGSEFEILERWPGRVARQISVEFHDWDKPQYRDGSYYDGLFATLAGQGYKVRQHELSRQGDGVGHWDTLLTL